MKTKHLWLLLVIALVLSGCSSTPPHQTYIQGEEGGERGSIKVVCDLGKESHSGSVAINGIDGKNLASAGSYVLYGVAGRPNGFDTVYLKPGYHYMHLYWRFYKTTCSSVVGFVAESGKSYIVRWKGNHDSTFSHEETMSFWVEEAETGTKVSGMPKP